MIRDTRSNFARLGSRDASRNRKVRISGRWKTTLPNGTRHAVVNSGLAGRLPRLADAARGGCEVYNTHALCMFSVASPNKCLSCSMDRVRAFFHLVVTNLVAESARCGKQTTPLARLRSNVMISSTEEALQKLNSFKRKNHNKLHQRLVVSRRRWQDEKAAGNHPLPALLLPSGR